jgi:hypothetical protein
MNRICRVTAALILPLLSGCAATWSRVDESSNEFINDQFRVELPLEWMRLEQDSGLRLSRDGVLLQRIDIEYRPHEKAFRAIARSSSAVTLPSELAEMVIAELKTSDHKDLEILDNAPITISGYPGFQLHLQLKSAGGLRIEILTVGFVDEDGFYKLTYRAPALHYFSRDRTAFELVTGSFEPR